jgi:hypothetical protein
MVGVYSVKRDVISRTVFSLRHVISRTFVTSHQEYHNLVSVVKILLKAFFVRNGNTAKSFHIVRNGNTAKTKEGRIR